MSAPPQRLIDYRCLAQRTATHFALALHSLAKPWQSEKLWPELMQTTATAEAAFASEARAAL